jgi:LmbE family N-acetylglucosaminyl deacetylase
VLGETRAGELHDAAHVLGVHDVTLLAHEDGMLPWLDPAALEADVGSAIRRARADVVVTFDEDGLYGHPDHVAVHERTTAAVRRLGRAGPALRYASLPRGAMRALVDALDDAPSGGLLGGIDPDAFGAMAPPPTLVLDVGRFAARKLEALRCHRTQVAGTALDRVATRDAVRWLGSEHYRRADVGAAGSVFIEALAAAPAGAALR